jgi:hypothetical protein
MPGKPRIPVLIFFLFAFTLLSGLRAFAQQPLLEKRVSFTFSSTPVASVLHAIGNKAGVKFSYNPDLIQPGRRITMRFSNEPLREVLTRLFNDPTLSFREIGNQIVIYRGDPTQLPPEFNQNIIPGKPLPLPPKRKPADTVYYRQVDTLLITLVDTIFRTVSITHFDTIRTRDTVFVQQLPAPGTFTGITPPAGSIQNASGILKSAAFYAGIFGGVLPANPVYSDAPDGDPAFTEACRQATSGSTAYSAGLLAGFDVNRFGIRTGLGFTRLSEMFGYAYTKESGNYFRKDTLETYYTVSGADTSWIFITDSTWIPGSSHAYGYSRKNSYQYLDIPLSAKITLWQNPTLRIYAIGGINASFLLSADAIHIDPQSSTGISVTSSADLSPFLLSWNAGFGFSARFAERFSFFTEAGYRSQTRNVYRTIPVDKRYHSPDLKFGLCLNF